MPDLSRDRFHVWLSTWHWLSNVVVGVALLAFGGIPYVLWGIFFRTTVGLHVITSYSIHYTKLYEGS